MKKSTKTLIGAALVLLVLGIIFGGNLGTSSIGGGIDRVYVPKIGTIECVINSTPNSIPEHITNYSVAGNANTDLFYQNILNSSLGSPFCLKPEGQCDGNPNYSLLGFTNWRDGMPQTANISYTCIQGKCEFSNPINWFQCPSDGHTYYKLYSVQTPSGVIAQNWLNRQPFGYGSSSFTSNNIVGDQELTFSAACVAAPGTLPLGSMLYEKAPSSVDIPMSIYIKKLKVYYNGTQTNVTGTSGCLSSNIVNATENVANGTGNLNRQIRDASGVLKPITDLIGQYNPNNAPVLPSSQSIPQRMSVGDDFAFIAGWEEIPAFGNVIQLSNGTKVVRSFVNTRTLFSVSEITLNDGTKVNVAGDVYRDNVQCLYNEECSQYAGTICDQETFTCEAGQSSCNVSAECGAPNYINQNNGAFRVTYTCDNHQCNQHQQAVTCNPQRNYPTNLCPESNPVCDGGTSCIAQGTTKVQCANECCPDKEDSPYYPKDCPSGKVCASGTAFSGNCITPPQNDICADDYCSPTEDKVLGSDRCEADCGSVPQTSCPFLQKYVSIEKPEYYVSFLGINAFPTGEYSTTTGCQTDWGIIILIAIVVIAGMYFLSQSQNRRKK